MEPGIAAGIGVGGMTGIYALLKCVKRILGFKSCKYHSKSNNDECIFGCKATKRPKKRGEPDPPLVEEMEEEKLSL